MVIHSYAEARSLTARALGFGMAVIMGLCFMSWVSEAAPSDPGSASGFPSPGATSPIQPGQQQGGQRSESMEQMRRACGVDVKKFCAEVKPGGGRILECLEDHSKEISDECYDLLEKRAERQKH